MTTLSEYLRENRPESFRAEPAYVPSGDYLAYFLKDVPHLSERLDAVVTLYLAADTRELVGCKIKGVRHILKTAGAFGVGVTDGNLKLGFFFFLGAAPDHVDQAPKMKWYDRLREWADVPVDAEKLQL